MTSELVDLDRMLFVSVMTKDLTEKIDELMSDEVSAGRPIPATLALQFGIGGICNSIDEAMLAAEKAENMGYVAEIHYRWKRNR